MHLLLWKHVMHDFICTGVAELWGTVRKRKIQTKMSPGGLEFEFEFIGVLRHMQRYFSHICDGTDVQADWRSCTYGRVPNAKDISQGSLTCPSYTDTGPPFI